MLTLTCSRLTVLASARMDGITHSRFDFEVVVYGATKVLRGSQVLIYSPEGSISQEELSLLYAGRRAKRGGCLASCTVKHSKTSSFGSNRIFAQLLNSLLRMAVQAEGMRLEFQQVRQM